MRKTELRELLDGLLDHWYEEVLLPLGLADTDPRVLPQQHRYWALREREVGKAVSELLEDEQNLPEYLSLTEAIFITLQDFLNRYGREALDPFGLCKDIYVPPSHPYYAARHKFISSAIERMVV